MTACKEVRTMAKTQKTLYFNPGLTEVVDAHSEATGASFTKIVTAALLNYFFNDIDASATSCVGPDPLWMKLVWGLENGHFPIEQVPWKIISDLILNAEEAEENAIRRKFKPDQNRLDEISTWKRRRAQMREHLEHAGSERNLLTSMIRNPALLIQDPNKTDYDR